MLPNIKFGHSCLFTCPPAIDKVKLNILKTRKTGSCIQKTSTHSLVTTTPTQQLHSTRFPSPAHSAPRPLQHPAQIYVLCPCTSALRTSINIIHAIYAGERPWVLIIHDQAWLWLFVYMASSPLPPSLSTTSLISPMTLQDPPRLPAGQKTWYKPPLTCHQGFDLAWPVPEVSSQPADPRC